MQAEEWRPVVGFEGYYEVSNTKKCRSVSRYVNSGIRHSEKTWYEGQEITPQIKNGYRIVCLSKNGKQKYPKLARIVAQAFPEICGEWFEGAVVNHKDEDKLNDVPENLEWLTPRGNTRYGTSIARRSENRKRGVIMTDPVTGIEHYFKGAIDAVYLGLGTAAGISTSCGKMKKGILSKHNGYYWRFS